MASGPPHIISYGEDPLTLNILSSRLDEVLSALGDQTAPQSALVIYRPSFGRGMGAHKATRQSTFGEFDAILGTPAAAYFIESKWHRSPEVKGDTIELRNTQVDRHRMLRWYRENWSPEFVGKWAAFAARCASDFERMFPSSCLPPADSTLRLNIEFVLNQLLECGSQTQDVVLYVGLAGCPQPKCVLPSEFRLVTLSYAGLADTGYFDMGCRAV